MAARFVCGLCHRRKDRKQFVCDRCLEKHGRHRAAILLKSKSRKKQVSSGAKQVTTVITIMDLEDLPKIQQTSGPQLDFQPTGDLMFDLMTGRVTLESAGPYGTDM
jgi:hypothetical protein